MTGAPRGPIKNPFDMAHTITLTPQELETVYLALNEYSLKYIHASNTWARNPFQKDYAHQKAEEVGALQVRIGDEIFETKIHE